VWYINRTAVCGTRKRNSEARSCNFCYHGTQISIFSECVSVALVIELARRMRRILLPCMACKALPYPSTLSHKRYDFRSKVTEHKACDLIFCTALV
jgi:hypothetical protein